MADLYDISNLVCEQDRVSGLGAAYYRGKNKSEAKTTYSPNGLLPLRKQELTQEQIIALQTRAM